MRPHPLEIAQAQGQGAQNLDLAGVFGMFRQGWLRPCQFRIQFGHHQGQDSVVHPILHRAADRIGLKHEWNIR